MASTSSDATNTEPGCATIQARSGTMRVSASPDASTVRMTAFTAISTATTARMNRSTRRRVCARACDCRAKKFIRSGETDLCRFALLCVVDLEQLRRPEPECVRHQVVREYLARGVIGHHRVVECLPRERHLVLGLGELLRQLHHVLIGLEVGIGLGDCEQPSQCAGESILGPGELLHGCRIPRGGCGCPQARDRRIA